MAEHGVANLFGGALRPNDPRRFLIEAMIGSMNADGIIDPREIAVLEHHIATHKLFRGLGAVAGKTLIDLSTDAIKFAGGAMARTNAIAKGLPARIHRLAAYGMAAEIAAADDDVHRFELQYLEALRMALRISPRESGEIVQRATRGTIPEYLDDRYLRIKSLIPMANDDHRFKVRDFFASIPDLQLSDDDLDGELFRAFRRQRAPNAQVFGELSRVAAQLPDPVDRYWIVVYTLVAELPATVPSWRVIPFIGVIQAAFQINDGDMELAVTDALQFPAAMPRPG
jgi:uncharacterized tellurite resistance protein B-like protein